MTPTFTHLVDWVDGRLDAARAAEVELAVAGDPQLAETVAWIRSFRSAGRSMPLPAPPESVTADLKAAFRRRLGITGSSADHRAGTTLDSRDLGLAAGTRGAAAASVGHLVIEGGGVTVTLAVVGRGPTSVDLDGVVTAPDDGPRAEVVLTGPDRAEARTARPDRDGRFRLDGVSRALDEIWILVGETRVHGALDLADRS